MDARGIRTTWDALAAAETEVYVGDPGRAEQELRDTFGRLGADPRGGVCVEVGCGPGRMTGALARRFDRVLALDVSPAMLARARSAVTAPNVDFRTVSGERLDGIPDDAADVLLCYLVLQHLPSRAHVAAYLLEFARVLAPRGEAFVQVPVLLPGVRPRLWRALRSAVLPAYTRLAPPHAARSAAFRGFRLTRPELERALDEARLRVLARDEGRDAPYRHSVDLFFRLRRA